MIGRRCINTMVRKDLLNHLLLLGSKRNFFSEYPIVSASTKGSNNLLLDLLCQNIGNSIKYSFYAPSQLNRFVATEERTAFSFLWIAKGIHNRNKWLVYSSLLIGKVSQTLWSMGTGLVLAQGKLRGNIKTHGLQYSIGELKVKVVKDSSTERPVLELRLLGMRCEVEIIMPQTGGLNANFKQRRTASQSQILPSCC